MTWIHAGCWLLLLALTARLQHQRLNATAAWGFNLLCGALWGLWALADHFTGEGINDATLFHVLHGWQGIHWWMFPRESAEVCAGVLILLVAMGYLWRRLRGRGVLPTVRQRQEARIAMMLGCLTLALHPAWREAHAAWETQAQQQAWAQLVSAQKVPVPPATTGHPPRSLVYIYAESLEQRFLDNQLFPGLTPELQALSMDSLSFRGIHQAPMTDWTIAGMVASQCGVPMSMFRTPAPGSAPDKSTSPWAAGRQCLGDWLHDAGYHLVYMGGANPSFAGKGDFYQAHQFDEVLGRDDLAAQLPQPVAMSEWGIYDDQLFQLALQKYRTLIKGDKPFALVLLTLDTHPPSGHATPACQGGAQGSASRIDGEAISPNSMLSSVHCSSRLIGQFIRALEAERGRQDVVIALGSDHLQMRSDISERLQAAGEREDLFLVRAPGISPRVIRREATTMDIAPTLLSLLGWDVPAWGLGRNMLHQSPTLPESYGTDVFAQMPPESSHAIRH